MNAAELLAELESRGISLRPEGDAIRYICPKGALTDELREAIRERKLELVALLKSRESVHNVNEWPPECLEAEKRFGSFESKLYPLLGGEVEIPGGRGVLWQVLSSKRVGVVIGENGEKQVRFFEAAAIRPVS